VWICSYDIWCFEHHAVNYIYLYIKHSVLGVNSFHCLTNIYQGSNLISKCMLLKQTVLSEINQIKSYVKMLFFRKFQTSDKS